MDIVDSLCGLLHSAGKPAYRRVFCGLLCLRLRFMGVCRLSVPRLREYC